MSAQKEQTEKAPAAAAAAPAAPKQYFKGVVKQVMDGGAVVIRGPPRNGSPAERILALTNIDAPRLARRPTPSNPATEVRSCLHNCKVSYFAYLKDEPFAWDAREFLRKMVVGKAVLGNVVHTANREYGVLLLGEDPETAVNVALKLVEEGLAKVRDNCQDKTLHDAQEHAKNSKKGVWGEGLADHVRKITWEVDNARALVDKCGGKPVSAVVEHVRDGTTLRLFLLPDMVYVTLMMSGVRAPGTRLGPKGRPDPAQCEPFATEAHYFTESRLLQREVKVILESHNKHNFVGSVIHPAGNIAEALLKEGMAKCVDWSIAKVTGGPEKYRAAEKVAKERKARIWKDYKPCAVISEKDKEFHGKVVEVVNGDALMVKAGKVVRKIHLASIRPPRLEAEDGSRNRQKGFKPLYDIPFMFEAREFLRKKLIGHQVQVTVDYIQQAKETVGGELGFPEKTCCTVIIGGVNVAEALVSKGLATVVRYAAGNDERSSRYDDLLQAEQKAEKTEKGLHDKKNIPSHRVFDMSWNVIKCKQFLPFLQRAGRMSGLVEFVASGSRFRVYIPRETCIVTFLLGGISCAKGGRTMPSGEVIPADPYGDECSLHVKEMVLQREVEIEVENIDKAGNFIGYLFVENTNLSLHLVQEGFASIYFTADRSQYANQIKNAEDNAKNAKKRIWTNYAGEEDPVIAQLYGQHVLGSPLALPVATSSLPGLLQLGLVPHDNGDCKSAESNLLVGSECVAKWMEDKVWYRARVDKVEGKFLEVTFLDYGNKESVAKCDVVKTAMDIPKGEDIDEFVIDVESGAPEVDTKQCVGLDIGDVIIAKWAEDNVWYNGEIIKFHEDEGNTVKVCFTDYGDTADVEMVNIVKTIKEIPTHDEVDENVLVTEESSKDALVKDALRIEDLIMTNKTEVDETVGTIRPGVKCWVPEVGSIVVAKWLEDEVWYNAKVEKITDEGYTVVFIDYGNSTIVKSEHILKSALDIPEEDCIDECVDITLGDTNSSGLNTSSRWSEGCVCIAQWSEDNVWYNAVVKSDLGNELYDVSFTDYGNNASVAGDKIVITASEIPPDQIDMIDECVNNNQIIKKELEEHEQKPSAIVDNDSLKPNATGDYDNATTGIPIQTTTADSAIPSACSKCYACWSEDNVWYNALIEKKEAPGVYFVTFTDYGNQETLTADRIVFKVDDIPVDQRDMVDENVEFETSEISEEQVVQGNYSARVIAPEKPRSPLSCMQSGQPEAAVVGVEGWTSKVQEVMKADNVVSSSRITEAQKYLDWSVKRERDKGLKERSENVWSRWQMMEEKFLIHQLKELLERKEDLDQTLSGKIQNILTNFKRTPLVFSRNVNGKETVVVVGTGGMYCTQRGGSELASTVKLIRRAVFEWITKFVVKCSDLGVEAVVNDWKKSNAVERSGREFHDEMLLRNDDLFVEFITESLPEQVHECFLDAVGKDAMGGPVFVWLRLKKKGRAGVQKEELWKKKRGQKLIKILKEIRSTCLLEDNFIVSRLSVFDEKSWPKNMEVVMARLWDSLSVWPFISYDGEGNGIWSQLGFYSPVGWECLVFGPGFFPVEAMEVLESPKSVVVGKNIHGDLMWILGSREGWRAIDLGVWTRDCPYHGHDENGLKKMFEHTVGFKKIDLKRNPEQRQKLGYIRSGNWARNPLDSRQLTYMAGDVTMTGTVVFDLIVTLIMEIGVHVLDEEYSGLEEFMIPHMTRLEDREWNNKLQHECHRVPVDNRSLATNVAGLRLSRAVRYSAVDVGAENEVTRRKRLQEQISRKGSEKFNEARQVPSWMQHPEERGKEGKLFCEKKEQEEMWD